MPSFQKWVVAIFWWWLCVCVCWRKGNGQGILYEQKKKRDVFWSADDHIKCHWLTIDCATGWEGRATGGHRIHKYGPKNKAWMSERKTPLGKEMGMGWDAIIVDVTLTWLDGSCWGKKWRVCRAKQDPREESDIQIFFFLSPPERWQRPWIRICPRHNSWIHSSQPLFRLRTADCILRKRPVFARSGV